MRFLSVAVAILGLLCAVDAPSIAADAAPPRIVCMGDSITDGNTYPLMIEQAFRDAGRAAPVCINAGVASDTAAEMRKRVERDVLTHHPSLVTLSVGINDVNRSVSLENFERDVRAIVDQVHGQKVPMILLTTTILGPKLPEKDAELAKYNAVLRKVAQEHGDVVAEVNALMQQARAAGQGSNEDDQIHINFPGYRLMARAVLDAMGHKDLAVPEKLNPPLLPGVITDWKILPRPEGQTPLDERTVATLKADDAWRPFSLPEKEPLDHWWKDQERQRGYAQSLGKLFGPAKTFWGIATLKSDAPRRVYFNTGGELQSVWVNGTRIYRNEAWTGWHAGKQRIAVDLDSGVAMIVIETSNNFFLSVTDNNTW